MHSLENNTQHPPPSFRSVSGGGDAEWVVQRSQFIGYANYCETPEEARKILSDRSRLHQSAHHHCYAWIIDPKKGEQHWSDDREPSGSAGQPIYAAIRSFGLLYTIVVVSRTFGGIKLGRRGLMNAYSHAATQAIQKAGPIECVAGDALVLESEYSHWEGILHELRLMQLPYSEEQVSYGIRIRLSVFVPQSIRDQANRWLQNRMQLGTIRSFRWDGPRIRKGRG